MEYKNMSFTLLLLVTLSILILIKIFVWRICPFVYQYFIMCENKIKELYSSEKSKNPWVLITGASGGMGKRFAIEFYNRGFNLFLIGTKRINDVSKDFDKNRIILLEKDFSQSFEKDFFNDIESTIEKLGLDFTVLINNVGYRTGWTVYEDMPLEEIKKTISVGTLVQSRLIQLAIKNFSKRNKMGLGSAILNITAQCYFPTDLFSVSNHVTVPYLACYEASNAFGFYQAKSVYDEIKHKYPLIDFLIITPGAVLTENTRDELESTMFSVDVNIYVKNIIKLLGNLNGVRSAYWGHSLSGALINIFPFVNTEKILAETGYDLALSKQNKIKAI